MCDAGDSSSQCAKGCVLHNSDEDETVIFEDEKPDEDEEFEQYSEISFKMELMLDYGSTEGKPLNDVANQISTDLKSVYQNLNPFDQAVTTVSVSIEEIERCLSSDDLGLQAEDVFGSNDCDPKADKRRKRRFIDNQYHKHTHALMSGYRGKRLVLVKVANVAVTFTGQADDSVTISPKGKTQLTSRINDALSKLGNHTEHLSDDQLCDYTSKSFGTSRLFLSQSLSRFNIQIKPIETKKPTGNTNFYLHSWMGSLKDNVKDLPLSMLAIPGSHNSASYDLEWKFTWEPNGTFYGTDPTYTYDDLFYFQSKNKKEWNFKRWIYEPNQYFDQVKKFYGLNLHLPRAHSINFKYSRLDPANEFKYFEAWKTCLRSNTEDQLLMGIRYFDYKYENHLFPYNDFLF